MAFAFHPTSISAFHTRPPVHVWSGRTARCSPITSIVRRSMFPLCCTDNSNSKTAKPVPVDGSEEAQLRKEQLSVYFQSSESTFQPSLASFARLSVQNFVVELDELLLSLRRTVGLDPPVRFTPPQVLNLQLSNEAVSNREREREFNNGETPASTFTRTFYNATCWLLDVLFDQRPIQRFWFLETIARMPYFAYSSCLHLYATLGWYRSPTLMNMHHAEELNEAYHLAVMESLGGDRAWPDRFLAFHASIFYYWLLVLSFLFSPSESYCFSQLIEQHAVDTYSEFLEANEATLRTLPAPSVSHEYFANFLYYFQEFQLSRDEKTDNGDAENEDDAAAASTLGLGARGRPAITSLYDVFANILLDEQEHSRTMVACSRFIERGDEFWYNGKRVSGSSRSEKRVPASKRREYWRKWVALQNERTEDS